ncbi:DUF6609 family protein [Candidatus Galacturonibacter soehngenii]|uniref:Uncharacterized protein n=1 Tax=Candidatus Galacturonatibacter soehngenii TaxID=2307010 RepID=A0A7V7QLN0_9FIRM|nr:DUF6609 family protein [Candidatus Galacturonibacter soehngenii]KAB1439399.1 hypothetical protein F7O84_03100 [Candidatus Galacturonibacter soehngenii]MBA4687261.1 hypothetical protein [Candidatus Galacturonibacter soehngenii]
MGFLGYKKGEIRQYNFKRNSGLWFIIVGIVIIISAYFGGEQKINPVIFTVGYIVGFYISIINRKVSNKLSVGASSKFQDNMGILAIVILFPLMFVFSGPFFPMQNWRMIWLGTFLAVGLHIFPFYFVHGISMVGLAILCSANAILGMFLTSVPFIVFAFIDGIIKIVFGIYLLFYSKQTSSRK